MTNRSVRNSNGFLPMHAAISASNQIWPAKRFPAKLKPVRNREK
jgi:hypothetical protein